MQVIEFARRLDARIAAERLNLQNSLLISLLAGNLGVETGSTGLRPPPSSPTEPRVSRQTPNRPFLRGYSPVSFRPFGLCRH